MFQKKEWLDRMSELQDEELDNAVLVEITEIHNRLNLEVDKKERYWEK